ncbi:MAG TPA: short-chain dehydrogenase, partial [Pantoea agglomerans]|nr:short-chain dehydrogenase [Pantoea agglomerans]
MNQKVALITGANRGLGRNGALKLAARGTDIILTYRSHADESQTVMKEIEALARRAVALALDVGEPGQFDRFVGLVKEALHQQPQRVRFDYLVNNDGYGHYKLFTDTTEAAF